MSKKKQDILTIEELIAKKEAIEMAKENNKTRELHIDSLDGNIIIERADTILVNECMELSNTDSDKADKRIVYYCVKSPNLKNEKLQEAYECIEPIDIVEKIFPDPAIYKQIATQIMNLSGYSTGGVTVVDKVKN